MGKMSITYQEYGNLIDELTVNIKESDIKFDGIYSIPRGGLPIGVHLSNHLNIQLFINIKQFIQTKPNGIILMVKDIMNEGLVFNRAIEIIEMQNIQFYTAVIFYKFDTKYKPDFFVKKTESWVIFPWEPINKQPDEYNYAKLNFEINPKFNNNLIDNEEEDDIGFMVQEDVSKKDIINIM